MTKPIEITLPDGTKVTGSEVPFDTVREEWNEYKLKDGTSVRMKTTVISLFHVFDDTGQPKYGAEGNPVLVARSQNVLVATAP